MRNKYFSSVLLSILLVTSLMVPLISFSIISQSQTVSATPGVWDTLAQFPGTVQSDTACYAENSSGAKFIYALESKAAARLFKYDIAAGTWSASLLTWPDTTAQGSGMIWDGADNIFVLAGGSTNPNPFRMYKISTGATVAKTGAPQKANSGSGLAYDGGDNIYALLTSSSSPAASWLYAYSMSSDTWTFLANAPEQMASGSTICKVGVYLYIGGGTFTANPNRYWRWSTTNGWENLASIPENVWGSGSGQEKVNENLIYATKGGTSSAFLRFIIPDNRWDIMENLPATVSNQNDRLAFDGTYLYMIRGLTDNSFWRYQVAKYFEKYCMPDLGQHSANWCWVASAANSIYWYSQHGYLQLIDDPADPTVNDNRYITDPLRFGPGDPTGYYRLFDEIASDCGHVWNQGVYDNEYFYGLQKFMNDQGVPLTVHEIVNPALVSSIPPEDNIKVFYRPPTLMDYEMHLENCNDVLLWLHYENTYGGEDTDHVVTGVAFNDNTWILVSDPWTTRGPDHNNLFDNKGYDKLMVLSTPNDPLVVQYGGGPVTVAKLIYISPGAPPVYGVDAGISSPFQSGLPGMTLSCTAWVTNTGNVQDTYTLTAIDNAGWNPTGFPPSITVAAGMTWLGSVDVTIPLNTPSGTIDNITFTAAGTGVSDSDSCLAQVTTYFIKYCMPDLGQHSRNWCWVAAAANSLYWYSQHGYPQLIDAPENAVVNDNNYITKMIATPPPPVGDSVYRLLQEIATDCLFPGVPENTITIDNTWNLGINDIQYFFGLQEFINEQGAPLIVHEIVDNNLVIPAPPPIENRVVYGQPTLEDYQRELGRCQDVLLWLNYSHENIENYERNETTAHVVTGVGFSYDNQWLIVSDPWTPGAPDHSNDLTHTLTPYDDLQVISAENAPLWVLYNGMPVQVSKMIFISPENVPENLGAEVHLVTGWNLVCFSAVGASDTPTNIFTGMTYYTDYYLYWWNAPGGPYSIQDPDTVLKDNIAYWVWIDNNKTVKTTGSEPASRDVYMVTGWNMVGFPIVDGTTTPTNTFTGLTYYTDYYLYWWNAPGGPYSIQDPDTVLNDNLGYWVWIDNNKMVTVP